MVNIISAKKKKGHFYEQSGHGQKGWTDSGLKVGEQEGLLGDQGYGLTVAIHDPLWRYIVSHYDKEIYDHINITSITVLGYESLPIAIELSQWGYDVTFICDTFEDLQRTKKDCEQQAGTLKKAFWFDYRRNVPQGAAICFIGVLDTFESVTRLYDYIDLLLRRNEEIVCAVQGIGWSRILEGKYDFNMKPYPDGIHFLLSIKALRE